MSMRREMTAWLSLTLGSPIRTSGRRVRLGSILVLVACAWGRVASAAEIDLADLPPELAGTIEAKLDAMAAAAISNQRMLQKLQEGRAKKVPAARIGQALVRLADDLLWSAGQLDTCEKLERSARDRLLDLAAELLIDGVERDGLAPALARVCGDADPPARLIRASTLYSFLTHRLGASSRAAWSLAFELLERDESEGAVNRLIPVLQAIYNDKRSIDRPLEITAARLREGATLRTARNELRDRFLRK